MRVAVHTGRRLPGFVTWKIPTMADLFTDDRPLIAAVGEQGDEAAAVVWSDETVDWRDFDIVQAIATGQLVNATQTKVGGIHR